jgi:histone H4
VQPGKLSKGGIRRLARRGGVKRLAEPVYEDMRAAISQFVNVIMRDTATILELTKKKTVTTSDVLYALKNNGRPLYTVS